MKFINNILNRLRNRIVKSHNVIDEMTVKYGEVDTSVKDIDVLYQEICKVRGDITSHNKLSPSGRSRCKKLEDDHNDRNNELKMELKILKELYRNIINTELNKFPLNKPCTVKYVADYIGVKDESIVWDMMTDGDIKNVVPYMYYDSKRYDISVTDLSESEVRILVKRNLDDWDDYHLFEYIHHNQYNTHTMILPNWRFVESMDSSIFYVERF